jgi:hypothetical protein
VIEIADVFRRFADGYLSAHGATILPSHRRAIADILACRTEAFGGHLWRASLQRRGLLLPPCRTGAAQCHADQTERWLGARKAEVLRCPTSTSPSPCPVLREALPPQKTLPLLMKAAAGGIVSWP